MQEYWPWLMLVLGFILGWLVAWLFGRGSQEALTERVEALEKEVAGRAAEVEVLRAQIAAGTARLQQEPGALKSDLERATAEAAHLRAELEECRTARASAEAELVTAPAWEGRTVSELEATRALFARLASDLESARNALVARTVVVDSPAGGAMPDSTSVAGIAPEASRSTAVDLGATQATTSLSSEASAASDSRSFPVDLGTQSATADDLTQISGIGPAFARRLNAAGILTYADLAAEDPAHLGEIVALKTWQKADTAEWVEQAKRLVEQPRRYSIGDDLTLIEGIGPAYATKLRGAGFTRFSDLAASSEQQLAGIIDAPAWRKVDYSAWIEQARLAAAGDEAGLRTLQHRLNRRQGDNLALIEGLGDKGVAALNRAGITTYADLAGASPDNLSSLFAAAGLRQGNFVAWIDEAKQRASGKRIARTTSRTRPVPTGATSQRACPQDLEQIQGIGGVFEQRLYAHGIGAFWEVGMLSDADFATILELKTFNSVDLDAIRADAMRLARETDSMGQTWDGSEPDDFAIFEGIGPVLERRLYAAGICTYRQLAEANEDLLKRIADLPAFQNVDVAAWVRQAKQMVQRG